MGIRDLINKKTIILDGAMGTMLQQNGLPIGEPPELVSMKNSSLIRKIHKSFIDSGADIIYTNTFGANRYKLMESGYTLKEVVEKSVSIAKSVCIPDKNYVALDIGPIGRMLEPNGTLAFEDAYDTFKEIVVYGKESGVDLIVFETMTDLYEVKAGILAAKENSNLPIFVTMTLEENGRTFLGCSLNEIVPVLEGLNVDAIGLNCSLGPLELFPIISKLCKITTLPIIVKPNAGLPNPLTNQYSITPKKFAETISKLYDVGVSIFGGCCGTSPAYIKYLSKLLKDRDIIQRNVVLKSVVSSSTKTVIVDKIRIIGERINPTGKKILKEAIKNKDLDYIIAQAIEQINAGASILDVNIGIPDINEKELMPVLIKALQKVVDLPLQIDSSDYEVIEAGLRVYNGKAIVNSVNGEDDVLDTILPIVKKYGASVVGLTLDSNGIPPLAEDRFKIAKKILDKALSYGIKKQDVYIDCLTLTVSAQQKEVMETIKALKMVKDELGLKTVLGVSNISFGLPNRELINRTFLAMALTAGLDLPIINPNISVMTDTINAYNVLANKDNNSIKYIELYSDFVKKPIVKKNKKMDLEYAILKGLNQESRSITKILLKTKKELEIVDNYLIKALDIVGQKFETGELFLPQLLQSAEAAQNAFEVLKESIASKGEALMSSKGKIILATVKGDIHDIGKNIVKILLENYGYEIIDLGKDVPIELIVETAKQNSVKLIGLSALMTTTIKNMSLTIDEIRKNNLDCKIIVGGAVLTEEHAIKMGADFYAKDANASIEVAKKVFA